MFLNNVVGESLLHDSKCSTAENKTLFNEATYRIIVIEYMLCFKFVLCLKFLKPVWVYFPYFEITIRNMRQQKIKIKVVRKLPRRKHTLRETTAQTL